MDAARTIAISPPAGDGGCGDAEPFALMVLGDAMAPEFREGDVVVVEPGGLAADGAYVVAFAQADWWLRRLAAKGAAWQLVALDGRYPPMDLPSLAAVRGVVIQRSTPGLRRRDRRYG